MYAIQAPMDQKKICRHVCAFRKYQSTKRGERLQNEVEHLFPVTGFQKLIEVDDEQKFHTFYEKLTATEVAAEALDEEWKGCVVPVSAGNNKQGFPMKHGVLTHGRVCLLLSKGHFCYRPRRTGERKRKSDGVAWWMLT